MGKTVYYIFVLLYFDHCSLRLYILVSEVEHVCYTRILSYNKNQRIIKNCIIYIKNIYIKYKVLRL